MFSEKSEKQIMAEPYITFPPEIAESPLHISSVHMSIGVLTTHLFDRSTVYVTRVFFLQRVLFDFSFVDLDDHRLGPGARSYRGYQDLPLPLFAVPVRHWVHLYRRPCLYIPGATYQGHECALTLLSAP